MKLFNKFFVLSILIIFSFIISSTLIHAASTGGAACSVTPASGSIAQNGELSFTVSSNVPSTASDLVLISATSFSSGIYSDIGPGNSIPAGKSSLNFKVHAGNTAKTGSQTFKIYCSKDTYVGGSPGGMSPTILDYATVSLDVTGTNPEDGSGGGSGNSSNCSVPNISLPPNSSFLVNFNLQSDASNLLDGYVNISGSSNPNISVTPRFSSLEVVGSGTWRRFEGRAQGVIKTGPNFNGGTYSATFNARIPGESSSECTATGNVIKPVVSNPSGKLKLTQVEYLNDTMFPESECESTSTASKGVGCRLGFFSQPATGPIVIDGVDSPVLMGADIMTETPVLGGISISRLFSLADPMNPTRIDSAGGLRIASSSDSRGDHGMFHAVDVVVSKDGKYSAMATDQHTSFLKTPVTSKIEMNSGYVHGLSDIVKVGSDYILLTGGTSFNVTNLDKDESMIDKPLPANFPEFRKNRYGTKIVLGDDSHVLVFPDGQTIDSSNIDKIAKLRLFSFTEKEPIAEFTITSESLPSESHLEGHYGGQFIGKISFTGGAYVYVIRSAGMNSYNFPGNWKIDVFKVEYLAKKITQVIKNASIPLGPTEGISAVAPFDSGNGNMGIITFNINQKSNNYTVNPYGNQEEKIKAFLLSDLASGKAVDILVNSPVTLSAEGGSLGSGVIGPMETQASSYSKNGITYVYTKDGSYNTKVWKFEPTSGSSSITPPPTGECSGGKLFNTITGKPCITPSTPVCTGGALFNTSTGQACTQAPITGLYNYYINPITGKLEKLLNEPTVPGTVGRTTYDFGTTTLKLGSTGEAVKELQRFLNDKLNLGLVIDGILGPRTIAVIKTWQSDNGLVPDGLIGPKTKALMNAVAN